MHALDRQSLHEVAYALLLRAPTLEQLDAQTHRLRAALGSRLKLDVIPGGQAAYVRLFTPTPAVPHRRAARAAQHAVVRAGVQAAVADPQDGARLGHLLRL